ncbi:MAG: histidine triad nucleotide-binding protein [Brevinematia bacterium]
MSGHCIFCKIANREVNSNVVYEDDKVIAIDDINPQAPVHVLVIPKKHIANVMELEEYDILGDIFNAIKEVAKIKGIDNDGFRVVVNHLRKGGQTVFHLHFHILGGRQMMWPPG